MLPDWNLEIDKAYTQTREALLQFLQAHQDEVFNFFAIGIVDDSDYASILVLNLDCLDNSIVMAKKQEQDVMARRALLLAPPHGWIRTSYLMETLNLKSYTIDTSDFKYVNFKEFEIEACRYIEEAEVPTDQLSHDGYLLANLKLLVWRVIERLIENNVFGTTAKLASPFYLGYQIYNDLGIIDIVVLRILNWPETVI